MNEIVQLLVIVFLVYIMLSMYMLSLAAIFMMKHPDWFTKFLDDHLGVFLVLHCLVVSFIFSSLINLFL